MEFNFDWKFYIHFYNDLKDMNYEQALNHWNKHGKKENRVCNKLMIKQHYINEFQKINLQYNMQLEDKKENKLNILIRTCYRPEYFRKAIDSILKQDYKNYEIFVNYDKKECLEYLSDYPNINIYFNEDNESKEFYKFNNYLNFLMNKVSNGYIMFLDDDDVYIHSKVFKLINYHIQSEENLVVNKFLQPDKIIYPNNVKELKIGDIDTTCFCFHSKYKNLFQWRKQKCGDYYFFKDLVYSNLFKIILTNIHSTMTIFNDKNGSYGI